MKKPTLEQEIQATLANITVTAAFKAIRDAGYTGHDLLNLVMTGLIIQARNAGVRRVGLTQLLDTIWDVIEADSKQHFC